MEDDAIRFAKMSVSNAIGTAYGDAMHMPQYY